MGRIMYELKEQLAELDQSFEQVCPSVLLIPLNGNKAEMIGLFRIAEDDESLSFTVYLPFQAPSGMRSAVAELVTRANFNLPLGGFQEDFVDGEVSLRIAIPVFESPITAPLIELVLRLGLIEAETLLAPLAVVCFGQVSPQAAHILMENDAPRYSLEDVIALAQQQLEEDD